MNDSRGSNDPGAPMSPDPGRPLGLSPLGALPDDALEALERQVDDALRTGDTATLTIVGYGEVSSVMLVERPTGSYVCKRLPLFASSREVEDYRACFEDYLAKLEERGVSPSPSSLRVLERPDGRFAAYCVQPAFPASSVGPAYLASCDDEGAFELFARIMDRVMASVDERLGLDGQLSNWVVAGEWLHYLDVTTPMMRDDKGQEALDTELFIRSLPWALRGVVRRAFLHQILDKYYEPRGVMLDFLGNLHKEGQRRLVPALLKLVNERLADPLVEEEVEAYYLEDAKMWALLQRLRRADRWWQLHVRRRTYEFLLPGHISRNL